MSTRSSIVALARDLRAKVDFRKDRDNIEHEIVADAPDGYVWSGSNVHQLVVCGSDGTPWNELYADMHERMSYGVERCEDVNCDVCHPDEQENK